MAAAAVEELADDVNRTACPGRPSRPLSGRYSMGQARELMDRVTQAVVAGDLDTLREIYASDVVVTTPDEGTLQGVDAFIEWNRAFIDAFSDRDYRSERGLET